MMQSAGYGLKFFARYAVICGFTLLASCGDSSQLAPFNSDGCSLFPDSSPVSSADWCTCCFEHDIAYWRGGTAAQRETADAELRQCVLAKTGSKGLAQVMYEGVRAGGSPYFQNWYRWGYGWGYERKYQALSASETAEADQLLSEYFANESDSVCVTN